MRVSEKSLELNVGAEILFRLRKLPGMRKVYLRGLTQKEESVQGVDFFAQLTENARILAFQFKAPKVETKKPPYRFTLQSKQHRKLHQLTQGNRDSVFYVFPFYAAHSKLEHDLPNLLTDTWFLPVERMEPDDLFGGQQSKVILCCPGRATANPNYELLKDFVSEESERMETLSIGIKPGTFAEWYSGLHSSDDSVQQAKKRKNPWLVRNLRVAIAENVFDVEE